MAGETIMALIKINTRSIPDAAVTPAKVSQNLGRRNMLINGDFQLWQRGTSFSNPSNTYTADRFIVVAGGGTTGDTVSRQSFTAGQTDVPNEPSYFFRFAAGATVNNRVVHQRIEDVRTFAGQTCTLTFWAKASVAHSSTVEIQQNFGSGGSASVTLSPVAYSMTTSWQKFTFTQTMPSIAGKTIGSSSYVYLAFIRSLGASSVNIDIAQMQFEAGSTASPFEHVPYALELLNCQRYYQQWGGNSGNERLGVGFNYSTVQTRMDMPLVVTMRSTPTLTVSSASHWAVEGSGYAPACTGIALDQASPRIAAINFNVASGLTGGQGVHIMANATGDARLNLSAEL
jgi:hypothetical protein